MEPGFNSTQTERDAPPDNDSPAVSIPGVDPAVISAAGLKKIDFLESLKTYNCPGEGILIPYFDFQGKPVEVSGFRCVRIKYDPPNGGPRYYCPFPKTHSYLPPEFLSLIGNRELFLVGSEIAALTFANEGIAALGCPGEPGGDGSDGYDGYAEKDRFTKEFLAVFEKMTPRKIIFFGERDALFDHRFSESAARFSSMLARNESGEPQVLAQCLPPDYPVESVNDCRAHSGANFGNLLRGWADAAVQVRPDTTGGDLAIVLLRVQKNALQKLFLDENNRNPVARNLARLAASFRDPLAEEKIRDLAETLGIGRRSFTAEVRRAKTTLTRRNVTATGDYDTAKTIDLSAQNAVWTKAVLEAVAEDAFVVGQGELARLHEGTLRPFNAAGFAAFADAPDKCRFTKTNAQGEFAQVPFTPALSQLVLGSTIQHFAVTRPVDFISSIPVLALSSDGKPDRITGYSRKQRILVLEHGGSDTDAAETVQWQSSHLSDLFGLLQDFDFLTDGSFARAIAMILTPALVRGGFLKSGRSPLFVISKDVRGAGGSFLCRIVCSLYGHPPTPLVPRNPEKLIESISHALFEGRSILYLDNVRGNLLSDVPFLESFLTEPTFDARRLYQHGLINVGHVTLMATSNGMVMSEDLADRVVQFGIRKRPAEYTYKTWPEGDIFRHIDANRSRYLGAIYGAIEHFANAGMPTGETTGLRFREWEAATSFMVEQILPNRALKLYPAGRSSREGASDRLSSPEFELVSKVCRLLVDAGHAGQELTAADILQFGGEALYDSEQDSAKAARVLGSKLLRYFRGEQGLKEVGEGLRFEMRKRSTAKTNFRETAHYIVSRGS